MFNATYLKQMLGFGFIFSKTSKIKQIKFIDLKLIINTAAERTTTIQMKHCGAVIEHVSDFISRDQTIN
jgi:hypothetical protein